MSFVQIIDFRTQNYEELAALDANWRAATEGRRTLRRSIITRDRNDPDHYLVFTFFDDHDSAMANSAMPETGEFAAKMMAIAAGPATFIDLDVIDDQS